MARHKAHMDKANLLAAAEAAVRSGDRAAAAQAWQRVVDADPNDARALNQLGNLELSRGNADAAQALLARAVAADPGQPALLFNHAAAARAAGDLQAALGSLQRALEADPYFVQAMFQMGVLYEEAGDTKSAGQVFRNFLDTAPPEVLEDPRFAEPLARAQAAVARDNDDLAGLMAQTAPPPSRRTEEAMRALLGEDRIYVAEPTFLAIPRLPAIPFLDRALTPWLDTLEAAAPAIIAEAQRAMGEYADGSFVPYVDNPPDVPANQWQDLDHSPKWGAFFFWKHGVRHEDHCRRFPATAAALEQVPRALLEGRSPNAFFSRLEARTRIPPHTGVTNARLTCHLPLIVPPDCGFRVGGETRQWEVGKAWVFDDTINHEAWNDSDQPRLILIFDIWHPMLDESERAWVTSALAAYDTHYGTRQGLTDTL